MSDDTARTDPLAAQPLRMGAHVPEIYVDGYQGATYKDGIVKLNFFSLALDPATNASHREVVMRMALSVGTILQVHQALGSLIADLEGKGVLRRAR